MTQTIATKGTEKNKGLGIISNSVLFISLKATLVGLRIFEYNYFNFDSLFQDLIVKYIFSSTSK